MMGLTSRVETDRSLQEPVHRVPVRAERVADAKLLWLNDRWFAERDVDVSDPTSRKHVASWLLERFGVFSRAEPTSASEVVELQADRYGGTGGSIHGGSGRAGSIDGFNGKGIGRTALAATRTDFHHSHGSLWLYEAVREAICSEMVAAELPLGAVGVVAIIDLGEDVMVEGAAETARKVVLVRPDFVRPAHCQRSILFGSSGSKGSDQARDALHVEAAVRGVLHRHIHSGGEAFTVERLFRKLGLQIGAGRALRLWQGQFTSSNLTIDGQMVDFGAFCGMPDWRRAERTLGERFGGERPAIHETAKSLCHYFNKYGGVGWLPQAAMRAFDAGALDGFTSAIRSAFGEGEWLDHADLERATCILQEYWSYQQSQSSRYETEEALRQPWPSLVGPAAAGAVGEREARLQSAIFATLLNDGSGGSSARASFKRFFARNETLHQTSADARFKKHSNPSRRRFTHTPTSIGRYINDRVNIARRHWPGGSERGVVLGHLVEGATRLTLVESRAFGRRWELAAKLTSTGLQICQSRLPTDALERWRVEERLGLLCRYTLPLSAVVLHRHGLIVSGHPVVAANVFQVHCEI